jgi:protocatechuate 3,4-dioxygenase beta subunit
MTRALSFAVALTVTAPMAIVAQQPARDANRPVQVGTAVVAGQVVVNDTNGQPVRRAIVTLSGGDLTSSRTAITDDDGKFTMKSLPPGRYTITATKAAYVPTSYGSPRAGRPGTALSVAAGQQASIVLRMTLGAVVSGVIRDERSMPVPGVYVGVSSTTAQPDRWFQTTEFATTDDRGVFRIFGLVPGEYVLAAVPSAAGGDIGRRSEADIDAAFAALRTEAARGASGPSAPVKPLDPALAAPKSHAFAPSFFPGTPVYTNAARIRLGAGEERGGVDFVMSAVPVATLSGSVQRTDGQSATNVEMSIMIDGPRVGSSAAFGFGGGTNPIMVSKPDDQGAFKFANILPGHYTLLARVNPSATPPPAQPSGRGGGSGGGDAVFSSSGTSVGGSPNMLFGLAEIDATGNDITGVSILLQPGSKLSGRVVFDATTAAPPTDITKLRLNIQPPGGTNYSSINGTIIGNAFRATQNAEIKADGAFTISGIAPGIYVSSYTLPPGTPGAWWLRSAIVGGKDVMDVPLEFGIGNDVRDAVFTFSDRRASLEGVLSSPSSRPAMDFYVAVFPTDRAMWRPGARRVKSTRPATDGTFTLKDLPPGEYFLAALTDLDPSDWNDPAFFEALVPASVKLTIGEGENKRQDLKIGG